MKTKKGFTLIEMLGIITILGIVLLVTFPNLSKSLKEMKNSNANNLRNNIKISAEAYIGMNLDKYPELKEVDGSVEITIQDLYNANLLKGKNDNIDTNAIITITKSEDGTLKYFYEGQQLGND